MAEPRGEAVEADAAASPPANRPVRPVPSLPIDDVIDQGPARHRARRGWFGRRKRFRHIAVLLPFVLVTGSFAVAIDQRYTRERSANDPFTLAIAADRPTGGDAPGYGVTRMPKGIELMGVESKFAPEAVGSTSLPGRPAPDDTAPGPEEPDPRGPGPRPQPLPTEPAPAPVPVPTLPPRPEPVPTTPPVPEPGPTDEPGPPNPGPSLPVPLPEPPSPSPTKKPVPPEPGPGLPLPLPPELPLPPLPLPLPLPTQLPLPLPG